MPSYLVTGVSRGLGYEFLRQFSSDPANVVIGLVRNKAETDKKVSEDVDLQSRTNIHILQADITDYDALKAAAAETDKITGGSLDYVIANAGIISQFDAYDGIKALAAHPEEITKASREVFEVNVIGNIHLFNLFMPLVLKGKAKKVVTITSGFADPELTRTYDIGTAPLYSASKAAVNMIVAKFSAEYREQGVLFLAVTPGTVDVGQYNGATPEQVQNLGKLAAKFAQYEPNFKGPIPTEESVKLMRSVIDNASVEKGHGGDFLSQFGSKRWL